MLQQAEVRGVMRDAQTGEALSRVAVALVEPTRQVITGAAGTFDLGVVPDGEYSLRVSTVGYRLLQMRIRMTATERREFVVALSPDTFQRAERIDVREDSFDLARTDNATGFTISGNDTKNRSRVLADDPLRAVQSMPGVSSNDDFDSRFSLHGDGSGPTWTIFPLVAGLDYNRKPLRIWTKLTLCGSHSLCFRSAKSRFRKSYGDLFGGAGQFL